MTSANKQANMGIGKKYCIRIAVILISIVLVTCTEMVFLSSDILKPESNYHAFFIVTTIVVVLLSLLALGLTGSLLRAVSGKSTEEIHALLKQFNGNGNGAHTHHPGNGDDEIVEAIEGMMNELCGLLQSVQVKLRSIDRNVEVLTKGIQQVATDQTNLFSLNAEIETARAQRDGFSVITGEILSLVERTGHLATDIRDVAVQLRSRVNEAISELEHVVSRVDLNQISMSMDATAYANIVQEKREVDITVTGTALRNLRH
jgi:methyl-accepting chemotaxis protein